MKKAFLKYHLQLLLVLLSVAVFAGSCSDSEEPAASSQIPESIEKGVFSISTRVDISETPAENAIRTIRVLFFSEDGSKLIDNHLYETSTAEEGVPDGTSYTYFAKVGDEYRISELRARTSLQIAIVANEPTSLSSGITKLEDIRNKVVNFATQYYVDAQGRLNINIDGASSTSNLGYVPMYAESGPLTHYQWDASNGKPVNMKLVRLLSKITVKLHEGTISSGEIEADNKVDIESVSIINVSTETGFTSQEFQGTPVLTAPKELKLTVDGNNQNLGNSSNECTFYIPENIIRQTLVNNQLYTYIQISGKYTAGTTVTETTYKIPLGNGVGKLTSINPGTIATLTRFDLCISRNTWYKVDAGITTHGQLSIQEIKLTVQDWEKATDIEGNIDAPILNISTKEIQMSAKSVDVHFWSNQDKDLISIDPVCIKKDANGTESEIDVSTIFLNLCDGTQENLSFHTEINNDYYPQNGYIRFILKDVNNYDLDATYTVKMHAGKLIRTICVTTNPQVGIIIFDPDGGTINAGEEERPIKYSELKRIEENYDGSKYSITASPLSIIPPTPTPPSGKILLKWVYADSETPINPGTDNKITITPTGYTTRIKAVWK